MSLKLRQQFAKDLQGLTGKECWAIIGGTGSFIDFYFGAKIPSSEPVDNEFLSLDAQNFNAEFSLFVLCVWRIDSKEKVIFGAWTEHEIVRRESVRIIG